jgi:hypothetical protein
MKQVLRFPVNTPIQVALRVDSGQHVEGRYGEQVLYSLADDRIMYVPPIVEQRIQELAIASGELFEIVKHELKEGSRRSIQWRVRRLPEQPELSADSPGEPTQIVNDETGAPQANGKQNGSEPGVNQTANGRGNGHAESNGPKVPAIPEQITGSGIRAMELALNGAAEIAQRVENRAAAKGYSLRFSNDDIRAIGLTIFIQAMRDAIVAWQR